MANSAAYRTLREFVALLCLSVTPRLVVELNCAADEPPLVDDGLVSSIGGQVARLVPAPSIPVIRDGRRTEQIALIVVSVSVPAADAIGMLEVLRPRLRHGALIFRSDNDPRYLAHVRDPAVGYRCCRSAFGALALYDGESVQHQTDRVRPQL